MSTTDMVEGDGQGEASTSAAQQTGPTSRVKLVVRRLPPTLPEDIFWTSVSTWVTPACQWKRYIRGRAAEGAERARFSRAYCSLMPDEATAFRTSFHGHVYRSKAGDEFQVLIEPAPLQKVPAKGKKRPDKHLGTIDDDPDYKHFLEHGTLVPKPQAASAAPAPPVALAAEGSTPIIDAIREKKEAKKAAKKAASAASIASDPAGQRSGAQGGRGDKAPKGSKTSKPPKEPKQPKQPKVKPLSGTSLGGRADNSGGTTDARKQAALASVSAATAARQTGADTGPILVAGRGRETTVAPSAAAAPATDTAGGGPEAVGATGGKKKGSGKKKAPDGVSGSSASIAATVAGAASATPDAHGDAGRGRRRGGASGRGGGAERGRSAHGAVVQILQQNSEAARGGPPGGRGRGRGRGGAPGATSFAARIDD